MDLRDKLQTVGTQPGVYQLFGQRGQVLYVGKAKNLKKRLSSYFRQRLDSVKTQALMAQVVNFDVIVTNSENEALLLEANLIKQFRPKYNVLLRDDKSYPYLYLSTHQKFPRLDFHRGARSGSGCYFGPYPNAGAVRETLALIQKLFKLRSCRDSFFKHRSRPCLQYQIKRCTAPCVDYVNQDEYQQQVQHAMHFLQGKSQLVIEDLIQQMDLESAQLNYERAAHFRDLIARLRQLHAKQWHGQQQGNIDVLAVAKEQQCLAITVLFIRAGRVIGNKTFYPSVPEGLSVIEALEEFLPQYYFSPLRGDVIIDRIIVSEKLANKGWLQNALREKLNKKLVVSDQRRSEYRQWQDLAHSNVQYALAQRLLQHHGPLQQLEKLQATLRLPNTIERIECFDVSHSQGEATVASCVVFDLTGMNKQAYRRFNIKNVTAGDDYAALRQAVYRRYLRIKNSGADFPDLVIIDGGLGQLRQAAEALEELQVSGVELMGVAKGVERKVGQERLFIWGREQVIRLPAEDVSFHLVQSIRDEAHRFAITAQRKQLSKKRRESSLQTIEGVGPKRRQQLLRAFGGLHELKRASVAEIAALPGISEKLAERIYQVLQD